jgi:hypothetical protein
MNNIVPGMKVRVLMQRKKDILVVLKWLHEQQCPWDENTCSAAVDGGNFEVLYYNGFMNTAVPGMKLVALLLHIVGTW